MTGFESIMVDTFLSFSVGAPFGLAMLIVEKLG